MLGYKYQDGVYVENITEQRVHSEAAVLALLSRGSNARTKGETQVMHGCTAQQTCPRCFAGF